MREKSVSHLQSICNWGINCPYLMKMLSFYFFLSPSTPPRTFCYFWSILLLYHTESSFSLRYTKPTRAAMMFCFVTVKQTGKVMIKTGSPSISFRLIMPLPLTPLRDLGDNSINRDIASSRGTWLMEPRPQLAGFYLFWDAIPELTNP